jgi:hypothetical protein
MAEACNITQPAPSPQATIMSFSPVPMPSPQRRLSFSDSSSTLLLGGVRTAARGNAAEVA